MILGSLRRIGVRLPSRAHYDLRMRILILGGTEFLSHTIARRALERGHDVSCLARGTQREPPPGTTFVRSDRTAGAAAYAQLEGEWDEVVDVSWEPAQVREALSALADRAKHWTYVSSLSVYADNTTVGADESSPLLEPLGEDQAADRDHYGEAKVACEQAVLAAVGDRALLVRAGLIAGADDPSDRFGYWPARFARDHDPVIVPDGPGAAAQVIGVTDLADWILTAAESGVTGTYNATGETVPLADVVELARTVADGTAELVEIAPDWLAEMNVSYWAGPDSLPLWLPDEYAGFATRSIAAAQAHGLRLGPLPDLMREVLDFEREAGLKRERKAGLSPQREVALIQLWRTRDASA